MKKILSQFLLTLLTVSFCSLELLANGNGVGNGGDAVVCRKSSLNSLSGYYSLDYLFQHRPYAPALPFMTLEQSLDHIEVLLLMKLPELAENFQTFRKNLFNTTDPTQAHFWESANFGLIDIKDEALIALVPENCRNGNDIAIVQAIIRVDPQYSGAPKDKNLYRFVPGVIHEMVVNNPVQLSYLLVHEWLWTFSDNPDRNRRVNHWLHSDFFKDKPRSEILKKLESVGFQVPKPLPDSDYQI